MCVVLAGVERMTKLDQDESEKIKVRSFSRAGLAFPLGAGILILSG